MSVGSISKQHSLRLEQAQTYIPQGLAVLALVLIAGHKIHLGPLPQGAIVLFTKALPIGLRHLAQRLGQGFAHPRADRKANPPTGLLFPIRVLEPLQQLVLMTGRVAPEVALAEAL